MYPPEMYPGPTFPSQTLRAEGWLWSSDDNEEEEEEDYEDGELSYLAQHHHQYQQHPQTLFALV